MLNHPNLQDCFTDWKTRKPFPYAIIDNFFTDEIATQLASEFPDFTDPLWHEYNNPLEIKKACNLWNHFPNVTYQVFHYLNSREFVSALAASIDLKTLFPDHGLNGGGWHIHKSGGKLNPHLDYSIHPKLPYQRKINLLCYLNPSWEEQWGGQLGFYESIGNENGTQQPGKLITNIAPKFNRAVFFDTTMNSWHGLCTEITCPKQQYRKSIALYYLTPPSDNANPRSKALYAPDSTQLNDPNIQQLIDDRADVKTAANVYRQQNKS